MSTLLALRSRCPDAVRSKKQKTTKPFGGKYGNLITKTLGHGNLREAVKLPPNEDINEWLAIHTVDFYNQINFLYATLGDYCKATTCPIMNAGPKYEYIWADGLSIVKPIDVSAPEYVDYLMNWIESLIDDETIFPQKFDEPFPSNFADYVKQIMKRMFRVYAHIYHSHFEIVLKLEEEAHLNTCFKHVVLFITEFKLVEKVELGPLKDLVETILDP